MKRYFTMQYWMEDEWYIGKLREVPGVFSQGETLEELKENLSDAYHMMMESDESPEFSDVHTLEIGLEV